MITKEQKDKLVEAARLHDRLVGDGTGSAEAIAAGLTVTDQQADAAAKAKADADELNKLADAQRKIEAAHQEARRIQSKPAGEDAPAGTPNSNKPVVTDRALDQGAGQNKQ